MKTSFTLRYAAVLAAFAFLACSKDDASESSNPGNSGTTAPYTITATMDDGSSSDTRISATDDGSTKIELKWETGDYIYVINGSGSSETKYAFEIGAISADGKTASFTCADYPANATPAFAINKYLSSFNPANVRPDIELYHPTTYSLSNNFPLFASYDPAIRRFKFKPFAAVLKLNVTLPAGASGNLLRVRIGSEDGTGIFYNGYYDITSGEAVRKNSTLNNYIIRTGSSTFTGNTEKSVYLPVYPGTELAGQILEIDLIVGSSVYTATIKSAPLEAGKCYPLTLGTAKWTARKIYEGGTGDEGAPYQIANEANLRALARAVRAGELYYNKYFKLTGDISGIETSAAEPWLPIGTSESYFYGTFDGNYKTVGGTFYLSDKDGTNLGFFGNTNKNISNLTLDGDMIYKGSSNPSDKIYLGGIVGTGSGEISGCTHTGALTAENTAITQKVYAGGIIGRTTGNITGCTQGGGTISVNAPGASQLYAGGIAGYFVGSSAEMHTCRNESGIVATGKPYSTYVGALAGDNNGKVYSCSTFLDPGLTITVNGTAQNPPQAIGMGNPVDESEHID